MPTKAKTKPKSAKKKTSTKKKAPRTIKTLEKIELNPGLQDMDSDFGTKYLNVLLEGKKSAKGEVFNKILAEKKDAGNLKMPLILFFASDLNGEKELINREMMFNLLEGLRVLPVRVVVVNTQQPSDVNNLSEVEEMMHNHIVWYNPKTDNSGRGKEEKEIDRLLLAADMAVLFNSNIDLIKLLMNYGVVVISDEKAPLLENYKPNQESGNSFMYKKKNQWGVFAAIVRALETYKFPYDWKNIVRTIHR